MYEGYRTNVLETFFQSALSLDFCCDTARSVLKGVVKPQAVCRVLHGRRLGRTCGNYSERWVLESTSETARKFEEKETDHGGKMRDA